MSKFGWELIFLRCGLVSDKGGRNHLDKSLTMFLLCKRLFFFRVVTRRLTLFVRMGRFCVRIFFVTLFKGFFCGLRSVVE